MKKLMRGLRQFQDTYVPSHKKLMATLAKGQSPNTLFITCSDSRVQPELITQAELGELFVIRNAGNIVPPFGATNGGEGATIEYAVKSLNVDHIIVCGHSSCGAMKGLLQIGQLEEKMPLVYNWLIHTEATRQLVEDNYNDLEKSDKLDMLVAENVLTQIENLRTYPAVRSMLHRGNLSLHGWIYNINDGSILAYDAERHAFVAPFSNLGKALNNNGSAHGAHAVSHMPGENRLARTQAERIFKGSY
ncbi:carbonic anhydrase [Leptolyngbyaceae cyanobacterium CCMR0082]|uniref:Carbonic anhydrase n=2 Tax=Adonisia turfae TaxID=2950184 RepID=A0A6M0SCL4_9CYAN|nr:carbonic anhydrase [Adonisia turfae]MDV3350806.1 carbonic anhydrase [Leptothoe sp. LEGE 181152]NEZ57719.1 carbonic anhydrase [Adonisia turfae CCMR0081]NEZ65412.1 carbonic anhydrase [Adonisia turfae CCMR0082]